MLRCYPGFLGSNGGERRGVVAHAGFQHSVYSPMRLRTGRHALARLLLLLSIFSPQCCWLTFTPYQLLSCSKQYSANSLIGGMMAPGAATPLARLAARR